MSGGVSRSCWNGKTVFDFPFGDWHILYIFKFKDESHEEIVRQFHLINLTKYNICPRLNDQGYVVFDCYVCPSVVNFDLSITFELPKKETSYLLCLTCWQI